MSKRVTPKAILWKKASIPMLEKILTKHEHTLFIFCKEDDPQIDTHVQAYDPLRLTHRHLDYYYIPWEEAQKNDANLTNAHYKTVIMYNYLKLTYNKIDPSLTDVHNHIVKNTSDSKKLQKQKKIYPEATHLAANYFGKETKISQNDSSTFMSFKLLRNKPSTRNKKIKVIEQQRSANLNTAGGNIFSFTQVGPVRSTVSTITSKSAIIQTTSNTNVISQNRTLMIKTSNKNPAQPFTHPSCSITTSQPTCSIFQSGSKIKSRSKDRCEYIKADSGAPRYTPYPPRPMINPVTTTSTVDSMRIQLPQQSYRPRYQIQHSGFSSFKLKSLSKSTEKNEK